MKDLKGDEKYTLIKFKRKTLRTYQSFLYVVNFLFLLLVNRIYKELSFGDDP